MSELILPDLKYAASYIAALREGLNLGVSPPKTEEEIVVIERHIGEHLAELNDQETPIELPTGEVVKKVPHNLFWMIDEEAFIGMVSIRYELNDFLFHHGGHVGYGIRPSRQNTGYGKVILKLALEELKKRGINRVLLTCDDKNAPSWHVIEANGGVLDRKIADKIYSGGVARRYWIDL